MFVDIIFSKDKELVNLNKKLGFNKTYTIDKLNKDSNFVLLEAKELEKSNINKPIFVEDNPKLTRAIIENKQIKYLVINQDSNLNQIHLKLMHSNNVSIVIPFNKTLNSKNTERIKLLNKIKNIIKLARKYKVKIICCTFASNLYELRSVRDLISFNIVLGMTPKEAKESFTNLILQ